MKVLKSIFTITFTSVILFVSCNKGANPRIDSVNDSRIQKNNEIPFRVGKNYFIKNTVGESLPTKIESQAEFDKYFGAATTMGQNGKPTSIDFSKEYIIIANIAETAKKTEMEVQSLKDEGLDLVLTYKVKEGEDAGFTMRPFLMIIVSNDIKGNVVLNQNL